jgi:hypothetical protein
MHLDGLPFGTRGGLKARHDFPADGEYRFEVQNFGIGSFIPGEQLEILIDGDRAHLFKYQGVGMSSGMQADNDGTLTVTVPVRAGSRTVGATFLQTNFRPSLDMIRQYDRKSLENNAIPQVEYYPAIGFVRISGPFNALRPEDSKSRRRIFTCRPSTDATESGCARQILSTLIRRAYRRPATPQDVTTVMAFYDEGRKTGGTFDDGIELALRRVLASPQFIVRVEREPVSAAFGKPFRITDLELASRLSFFLWSSIPDDELITLASQGRLSNARVLGQQVRRMLNDPKAALALTILINPVFPKICLRMSARLRSQRAPAMISRSSKSGENST